MGDVENPHAFQLEEVPVGASTQFAIKYSPDSAAFTDEKGPQNRLGELKAFPETSAAVEGGSDPDAFPVIPDPTRSAPGSSCKRESG